MIKIENVDVYGWEAAIRGMRNAKNSWAKSDSYGADNRYVIGPADHKLMMTLARGGSTHAKYRRMINVTIDVVAPLYVISEMDTYKVGTVRNSCSFMHKGVSKPFEITDFSVHDNRIYEILSPLTKKDHNLVIPYETDEYKIFVGNNGRKYRVYRNGRVVAEKFECIDSLGVRHWTFPEKEVIPSQGPSGYWYARLGGRNGRIFFFHRLVAALWVENPNGYETVNHINGNKGDNSAENLEWCSRQENITKGFETGLYENGTSLHCLYIKWKNGHTAIDPLNRARLISEKERGATAGELAAKYGLTKNQVNAIVFGRQNSNAHIFETAYTWEEIVHTLNELREAYLETGDESYFQQIRALLPSGYNQRFTLSLNYEVLAHMYHDRKNHRLDEWREFCEWIKTLSYSEFITLEEPDPFDC